MQEDARSEAEKRVAEDARSEAEKRVAAFEKFCKLLERVVPCEAILA